MACAVVEEKFVTNQRVGGTHLQSAPRAAQQGCDDDEQTSERCVMEMSCALRLRQADGMTDEALVALAVAGDAAAFDALYRRYHQHYLALATWLVRNPTDAKDVVQNAFLNMHRALATFEPHGTFRAWSRKIVFNAGLMHLRSRRAKHAGDERMLYVEQLAETRMHGLSGECCMARGEMIQQVRDALEGLPDTYRRPLELALYDELSLQVIGEQLGLTIPTVKTRLHRARNMVREALGADFMVQ
jgi:RNA polymerase sigma-70 factor (ECF subfamily)